MLASSVLAASAVAACGSSSVGGPAQKQGCTVVAEVLSDGPDPGAFFERGYKGLGGLLVLAAIERYRTVTGRGTTATAGEKSRRDDERTYKRGGSEVNGSARHASASGRCRGARHGAAPGQMALSTFSSEVTFATRERPPFDAYAWYAEASLSTTSRNFVSETLSWWRGSTWASA